MSIIGEWDVTIKTPIGSMAVVYVFTESGGALAGSATLKGDTVPLDELAINDTRVRHPRFVRCQAAVAGWRCAQAVCSS
jgi:hypothetical protein